MADLWEKVKIAVGEIYTTASGKAVDGVNLGVKRLDEATIRRELSKEFAGLGGRTYQLLKRDQIDTLPSDPTVRHHMERLEALEERLEEKEQEIQDILRSESQAKTSSAETSPAETSPAETSPAEETPSPEEPAETAAVESPPTDEPKSSDESDPPHN